MHYGQDAFVTDSKKLAMTPKKPTTAQLGQRKGLSDYDVQKITKYYGCKGTVSTAVEIKPKCKINGVEYVDGEQYVDGNWLMKCVASLSGYSTNAVGCVTSAGVKIANGGTFTEGNFVFKCIITGTSGSTQVAGCVSSDKVSVLFGQTWTNPNVGTVGGVSVGYQYVCTQNGANGYYWATVKCACIKPTDKSVVIVSPGCFNQCSSSLYLSCTKATSGTGVGGMSFPSTAVVGGTKC